MPLNREEERAYAEIFLKLRYPDGWSCPRCHGAHYYLLWSRPRVVQCANDGCKFQRSVTGGTVFHGSKLPLKKIVKAAALFCKDRGTSSRKVSRVLKVHVRTAWQLLHRIRYALTEPERTVRPLGIPNDETLQGSSAAWTRWVYLRKPKQQRACAVLLGCDGAARVITAAGTSRAETSRHLEERSILAKIYESGVVHEEVSRSWAQLNLRLYDTYHSVSQLWLPRYVGAYAYLWRTKLAIAPDPPERELFSLVFAVLWRSLGRTAPGFARIRPPPLAPRAATRT